MVTKFSILYSVSAVRRLLGLGDRIAVKIQEFGWVIWVWVSGKRPTFISKKAFKQHFVDKRRAAARGLVVTRNAYQSCSYSVRNESKDSVYKVVLGVNAIACECDDYRNQTEFFGHGVCKHGYAVLAQIGYSSLKDYLKSVCF
ncbi:hypothetical protein Syn7502_02831 [Synechococcus sp. PCC 7502]|uniref:hypothetical protein n=1 Tax=Synechococcus sp. PCC 7502 TaxID=1173263 RepID=UPI00029FC7CC|nr:hypothetical protein [Synechococcus sp. PCC 7502]AFY74768.1 hypothetical protein Syn7502_02831 [Synechococcus sp. PCC 7502]